MIDPNYIKDLIGIYILGVSTGILLMHIIIKLL